MIVRTVKLRPTKSQEAMLNEWLWNLTGLWNWAIKKIEHDAQDKTYHSEFDFINLVANHSKRMEIPSHTMQGVLLQAHRSWQRCFKKLAKRPRLKGKRNALNSISFPDPIKPPHDATSASLGSGRLGSTNRRCQKARSNVGGSSGRLLAGTFASGLMQSTSF